MADKLHQRGFLFLLVWGCLLKIQPTTAFAIRSSFDRCPPALTSTTLAAADKPNKKQTGVYSRPSAAIERGSGFFVPGLEGPKVRLMVGLVLLSLVVVNSTFDNSIDSSNNNIFSTVISAAFASLVLFQAAVEFQKESVVVATTQSSGQPDEQRGTLFSQRWSIAAMDKAWKNRVEWAASSFLSLTAATDMMLIGPGAVIYSLLGTNATPEQLSEEGCRAALDTLSKSSSGRVALPPTHPTFRAVNVDESKRCVILQRVDENMLWLVASDQLLASFTQQDLRWLGRVATYVEP